MVAVAEWPVLVQMVGLAVEVELHQLLEILPEGPQLPVKALQAELAELIVQLIEPEQAVVVPAELVLTDQQVHHLVVSDYSLI